MRLVTKSLVYLMFGFLCWIGALLIGKFYLGSDNNILVYCALSLAFVAGILLAGHMRSLWKMIDIKST